MIEHPERVAGEVATYSGDDRRLKVPVNAAIMCWAGMPPRIYQQEIGHGREDCMMYMLDGGLCRQVVWRRAVLERSSTTDYITTARHYTRRRTAWTGSSTVGSYSDTMVMVESE